ncbi:hypothetical protein HNR19_003828 [Nocardioides thalensis]|uniref:Uncharacterized protein n=1 Tax=Nocardioides thalensis TaxID=1914755 RepID=A0A853C4V2_9ACTN|nr:hypothetical protein [Nocardioides thalensis]NYJ03130.1 hypothetical protein [Nocardioides thalensis]
MTDPRIVEPQRVVPPTSDGGCGDHVFWCWKRITGTVLLTLLVLAGVVALVWWLR